MWKDAIEESNWKQKAAMPEFWDGQVDWFEELVRKSDRARDTHETDRAICRDGSRSWSFVIRSTYWVDRL